MESVDDNNGDEPGSSTNDDEGNKYSYDDITNKCCRYGIKSCKMPSHCDKCGAIVRWDVLTRHQKTAKGKAGALEVRKKKQGKSMNKVHMQTTTKETEATARQLQRR